MVPGTSKATKVSWLKPPNEKSGIFSQGFFQSPGNHRRISSVPNTSPMTLWWSRTYIWRAEGFLFYLQSFLFSAPFAERSKASCI